MLRRVILAAAAALCLAVPAWAVDDNRDPFVFPQGGVTKVAQLAGTTLDNTHTVTLLTVATGNSGVVRHIFLNCGTVPHKFRSIRLNVFYDGHTSPDFTVPLQDLIASTTDSTLLPNRAYSTPFWSVTAAVRDTVPAIAGAPGYFADTGRCYLELLWPLPYTNGIKITLTNPLTAAWMGGDAISIYASVAYQTTLPACWNRNYRLMVSRDSTVSDSTNTNWYHTFFTRPAGKAGAIATTFSGVKSGSWGTTAFQEGDPAFYVNGDTTTVSARWSSWEDYFLNGYFFDHDVRTPRAGITCVPGTTAPANHWTAYHNFAIDPLLYANGCRFNWPIKSGGEAATDAKYTVFWITVYYERTGN